jgi:hypothetical protein
MKTIIVSIITLVTMFGALSFLDDSIEREPIVPDQQ